LRVILDRTVFCPAGEGGGGSRGGWPSDRGWLSLDGDDSPPEFKLTKAEIKQAEIWHYLEPLRPGELAPLAVGQTVTGALDWEARYPLMRLASAGVMLHFALVRLGLLPAQLRPLRAGFGAPPYLAYENLDPAAFAPENDLHLTQLQTELNRLLEAGLELKNHYYPALIQVPRPENELYREPRLLPDQAVVQIELQNTGTITLALAQGGYPLVATTREIGPVIITAIEPFDEQVKINIQLEA
jgi:alanyl-tRNA synthetase